MARGRVLVIDDEAFIRDLVCDFFDTESIACDSAATMPSALDLLRRNSYNLVLLDRNLESTRGEQMMTEIRRIQPRIPVVILTGDHHFDGDAQERIAANGIIHKPFKIDAFMQSVRKFLESE